MAGWLIDVGSKSEGNRSLPVDLRKKRQFDETIVKTRLPLSGLVRRTREGMNHFFCKAKQPQPK